MSIVVTGRNKVDKEFKSCDGPRIASIVKTKAIGRMKQATDKAENMVNKEHSEKKKHEQNWNRNASKSMMCPKVEHFLVMKTLECG